MIGLEGVSWLCYVYFHKKYELGFWEAASTFLGNRSGKLLVSQGVSLECVDHKPGSFSLSGKYFWKVFSCSTPVSPPT